MPAKHAEDEEARSVLRTKHHQVGVHRNPIHRRPDSESSLRRELSLLHWLTSTATKSRVTETSNPAADGRSLQQWRSIQGKYWLELQRVQHSIQQTLEHSRDPSRRPTACSPIAVLEQLRDRIRSVSQDMHALNRSVCVEMATSSAPQASGRAAVRLRAFQARLTRTTQEF